MGFVAWASALSAAALGWLGGVVAAALVRRLPARRRVVRVCLLAYVLLCGIAGTAGLGQEVWSALAQGTAPANVVEGLLLFAGFALLWPLALALFLVALLAGGHG